MVRMEGEIKRVDRSRTACAAPIVAELPAETTPEALFGRLTHLPGGLFLDSAQQHEQLGRYSYVAVDPFDRFEFAPTDKPLLHHLQKRLTPWHAERLEGLPPWQGGAAFLASYDIGRSLERLPSPRWDEFRLPALVAHLYDLVIAFDHHQQRCWAFSHGFPATDPTDRADRAKRRLDWLMQQIDAPPSARDDSGEPPLARKELAPTYEQRGHLSNFSRDGYLKAVQRVMQHLRAGDAFQVNLAQRLLLPDRGAPVEEYLALRRRNPATFGAYFDGGPWQILSASPERFVALDRGEVETRPIKGTSARSKNHDEDRELGEQLLRSEKERAENVMIVDLLRNDLSRVCTDDSVQVPTLFGLEPYAHVQHLVSVVRGKLRPQLGPAELLSATLPGGSVTGAPKVRVQEIIAAIEPTARGAYCGTLGWIGYADCNEQQAMDSSVLIRTLTRARGWLQAPVGGGITIESDPEAEYEETWHKAAGLVEEPSA